MCEIVKLSSQNDLKKSIEKLLSPESTFNDDNGVFSTCCVSLTTGDITKPSYHLFEIPIAQKLLAVVSQNTNCRP